MPFIAPAVPTGMKAGVRTTPCGVVSRPVRAGAVGREQFEMIGKAHAVSLWRDNGVRFNLVDARFSVRKPLTPATNLPHKPAP